MMSSIKRKEVRVMATLYGFIAIIMWGVLALLGTFTKEIPAFQLLFMCFFISSLIFLLYKAVTRNYRIVKTDLSLRDWLVGIFGLYGFHFCYFIALKYAEPLEVSLIAYLWPLLFAIFVATKDKQLQAIVGGVIGFVGISFILSPSKMFSFNWDDIAGYLLAFCCALIWSSYSWYFSNRAMKKHRINNQKESLSQSIHEIGYFSIFVCILSLASHFILETSQWQFNSEQILGTLFLGLGPVGGAFYLWQLSLKSGNQLLLSSLSYCSPLFTAMILSALGLSSWTINIIIAVVMILIGACISNFSGFILAKIKDKKVLN
ncbi:DMT family transporter [Marinomonas sp. PE14-40]|uniref:DMT family transporter n=1 Tax=Marinomonas sp. PE14-40 TaxID=3060621 RepID=UPI003F670AE8